MAIAAETERMMRNWARWKTGAPIGVSSSSAYELEGRGRREEVSIPLLNGEAIDVDKAVHDLPGWLHEAVWQYWIRGGSVEEKARRCHCAVKTLYRRLDEAHGRIHVCLDARRQAIRRVAAVDTAAGAAPRCTRCSDRHWLREACATTDAEAE